MRLNFAGQNLQGRSFKGQNLTGANFSNTDIRGTNFTNAILQGTNFNHAKAGLQSQSVIGIIIVSLLLSALSGLIASWAAIFVGSKLLHNDLSYVFALRFTVITLLTIFFFVTISKGLGAGFRTVALATVLAGVFAAVLAVGTKELAGALTGAGMFAGTLAGAGTWAGILAGALVGALGVSVALAVAGVWVGVSAVVVAGVLAGASLIQTIVVVVPVAVAVAFATTLLGGCLAWRALALDQKFAFVRTFALAIAATGGTNFRGADLTDADFQNATLKNTNFTDANITRTYWLHAKKLDFATVGNSILANHVVRDLLVSGNGYKKSYENTNLKGANLTGANLNYSNLTEADISQATLHKAFLEEANLTKAQAVGTDFTCAYLTGACLSAWNIDSTTKLEQVNCRYVYLLQNERERRPSSGEFKTGEFTKLFSEVLNTVDLIFRNGVDWKAFVTAFKTVQVENEDTKLTIQSIENKGDGVVVVKVSVPENAQKEKIHSDFTQSYSLALKAIEEKYRVQLEAQDELINSYRQQLDDCRQRERQQNADIKEIISLLASKPVNLPVNVSEIKASAERKSSGSKLIILTLGDGDFERGFSSVTVQILTGEDRGLTQCVGQLPPAPKIAQLYSDCFSVYKNLYLHHRIKPKSIKVSNSYKQNIERLTEELEEVLNKWLNSETFLPINNILREKFMRSDEMPLIIQSENPDVRRLPWHLWDFCKSYRKTEVALSAPSYDRVERTVPQRAQKRILAILGDSTDINVDEDRKVLENLYNAETVFLVEPDRSELNKQLWDENGWDILCFSGHSSSKQDGTKGWIHINKNDKLMLDQLENALRAAIGRGLQLAIFNSCDGLGLARYLASLHIPQLIIMREPVPDLVAQEFFKNFLKAFSSGKSFYLAVRQAREMLQALENEFPCATWLPVICQNPAEMPMIW